MPKMGYQDHLALKVKLGYLVSWAHRDLREPMDSVTSLSALTMQAWLPGPPMSKGPRIQGVSPDLFLKLEFIQPTKSSQMSSTLFLSWRPSKANKCCRSVRLFLWIIIIIIIIFDVICEFVLVSLTPGHIKTLKMWFFFSFEEHTTLMHCVAVYAKPFWYHFFFPFCG